MTQLDRCRASTAKLLLSVTVDGDYYGGSSAAVPFKWESQPGTPSRLSKRFSTASGFDSDSDFNSPVSAPLTPPPSYFYTSPTNPKKTNSYLVSKSSSSSSSSPLRKRDLHGSKTRGSMSFGSKHNNSKSLGCYTSIVKVLLR